MSTTQSKRSGPETAQGHSRERGGAAAIRELAISQLQMCQYVVRRNVGDVTHAESVRTFAPLDNSLNWILGHLVATRSAFLAGLGAEPIWSKDEARAYAQHAPPMRDAGSAKPLAAIWAAYDLAQARLLEAITELTDEQLEGNAPPELTGAPDGTIAAMLATLGMHDAYHSGQTGVYRRLLGRPPADL
jgi:uncharacterized damage-inducible protein DinB